MECLVKLELKESRLNLEAQQREVELEFACTYLSREGHRNAFPLTFHSALSDFPPIPPEGKNAKRFT